MKSLELLKEELREKFRTDIRFGMFNEAQMIDYIADTIAREAFEATAVETRPEVIRYDEELATETAGFNEAARLVKEKQGTFLKG